MFTIEKYKNKWAVLDLVSGCFYFPEKSGKRAALEYARVLNQGCGNEKAARQAAQYRLLEG